jgi:signal transduction histidine kinase
MENSQPIQRDERFTVRNLSLWEGNKMEKTQNLSIRPYARLLTMLGEQLIKNERIALIEIIKNSYDADADWVKVTFQDFDENFNSNGKSKILIEDNGTGMTLDVIKNQWLNPATPEKLKRKNENKRYTNKGRVIQGEKGIGRFAMLKLGKKITIATRPQGGKNEYVIEYNFSKYDNEFLTENGKAKELFLDDLNVSVVERKPECFNKKSVSLGTRKKQDLVFGTVIEISDIKTEWTEQKIGAIFRDTIRLNSNFFFNKTSDFEVLFYRNNNILPFNKEYLEKLNQLLEYKSVITIKNGKFDDKKLMFSCQIDNQLKKIKITDPKITGLKVFNDWFGDAAKNLKERSIECGPFEFDFYIFDFSTKALPKYELDKDEKNTIKEHRIYLYRDQVRVYPYGEPDDDWLRVDEYRGKVAAGDFLSNDQVVGCINITQEKNPKLKDKTNREGLIEEGNATNDFIVLIQTFLAYIRKYPYRIYKENTENKTKNDVFKTEQVVSDFSDLKEAAGSNSKLKKLIDKAENDYTKEKEYLVRRAETTEELAGVGLSVETASHDIMSMMEKVLANLYSLINDLTSEDEIDKKLLQKELESIYGQMTFIANQLKDIQLLFKSSKQKRHNIKIIEIIKKIEQIYKKLLKKENIEFQIKTNGSPLIAKTTDAVLMQVLLNLIDNAVYWLKQIDKKDKRIEILLDGNKWQMIFSDNGPGIDKDDTPYIFEPFYSGKGEEGRGLGLYIARQLLERNDYSIDLADISSEKKLSGANFVVNLISGDEN